MTDGSKLIFAPFKGLTNKVYRNAFARHFGGFDQMVAPFISGSGSNRINPSKLSDITPAKENLTQTIPQLISTNAAEIITMARTLHNHGFTQLNWNLGCPFPRIAEKYRGCGILPYPDKLDRILHDIFATGIPLHISIKTRLGYKDPAEITEVIRVLNNYPLHSITIHTRTGKQRYRGETDPEAFARCQKISKHKLIYNGDLYNLTRFRQTQKMFPANTTWMIGRGALMNPFLPMEIKGVSLSQQEKTDRLLAFHEELLTSACQTIPQEKKCLGWMKAIWYYMAGAFQQGESSFQQIKTTTSLAAYRELIPKITDTPFANEQEQENYFRCCIKHV